MKTIYKIKVNTVNDVYELNRACISLPCETMLISGRYLVDAKSLMGIFSLNLSNPIELEINNDELDLSEIMKFEVE